MYKEGNLLIYPPYMLYFKIIITQGNTNVCVVDAMLSRADHPTLHYRLCWKRNR